MTRTVLRLDTDDVWSAVESIDTVALLAEELLGCAIGEAGWQPPTGTLAPWRGDGDEYVLLSGGDQDDPACAMPATSLRHVQAATLAALATRELLAPGGVTLAMLGTPDATQQELAVLARHVPDIVHVAVPVPDAAESGRIKSRLIDQLDLAGIGFSVVNSYAESLFGANLVVVTSAEAVRDGLAQTQLGHLVRGTLVVNASGQDLPDTLVDGVDLIYVDDLALLPEHTHRRFVGRHRDAEDHHHGTRAIANDLGHLLAGTAPGRAQDDIVLVELLRANELDVHLACWIADAARRGGHGTRVSRDDAEPWPSPLDGA